MEEELSSGEEAELGNIDMSAALNRLQHFEAVLKGKKKRKNKKRKRKVEQNGDGGSDGEGHDSGNGRK